LLFLLLPVGHMFCRIRAQHFEVLGGLFHVIPETRLLSTRTYLSLSLSTPLVARTPQ
jgi:hypothetical protein